MLEVALWAIGGTYSNEQCFVFAIGSIYHFHLKDANV